MRFHCLRHKEVSLYGNTHTRSAESIHDSKMISSFKGVTLGGTIPTGLATAFSFPAIFSVWSTQEYQIILPARHSWPLTKCSFAHIDWHAPFASGHFENSDPSSEMESVSVVHLVACEQLCSRLHKGLRRNFYSVPCSDRFGSPGIYF